MTDAPKHRGPLTEHGRKDIENCTGCYGCTRLALELDDALRAALEQNTGYLDFIGELENKCQVLTRERDALLAELKELCR